MLNKVFNFFISGPCAICALICATIAWLFSPTDNIPIFIIYFLLIVFFVAFAILKVIYENKNRKIVFDIKKIVVQNQCIHFLVTNDNLLLQNTLLSIVFIDDGIEQLFGIGFVMTPLNDAGFAQIDILKTTNFGLELFNNNNKDLNKLKNKFAIKMSLTKETIEDLEV